MEIRLSLPWQIDTFIRTYMHTYIHTFSNSYINLFPVRTFNIV